MTDTIGIFSNRWDSLIEENDYNIDYSAKIEFSVQSAMSYSDDELNIFKWIRINGIRAFL